MKNSKFFSIVLSVVLSVLGVALLTQAATTISTSITTAGNITTSAGNLEVTAGTLTVGGASTLTGAVGITGLTTMVNASTTRVSVSGNLMINAASSTGLVKVKSLKVGVAGTSFTKMIGDYCSIATKTITASTTGYMNCTPRTTGLVAAGDPVMVMATSSLDKNFHIIQASSSATNVIGLAIYNSGEDFSVDKVTGQRSFNFLIMSAQ
jgi:hypothetical protein